MVRHAVPRTPNLTSDRMVQRKDRYDHPNRWEDYEDEESQFGWFIEAIDPVERRFASNLRPVSYRGRQPKGGKEADTGGARGRSVRLAAACRSEKPVIPGNPPRARRERPLPGETGRSRHLHHAMRREFRRRVRRSRHPSP